MFRPLLSLLPLAALCLPALAGMPAGLTLGENEKDVIKKVSDSKDFTPINERAKRRLDNNYHYCARLAGQQWLAHFTFDRRSKMLTQLLFVNDKPMQPNQYDKLLKSFYVFTAGHLREHFQLKEALNTPGFGHAGGLKEEEMFPLHAFPGDCIMLTTGLWKAKGGGIHLCFTVQPSSNSAMGMTYTTNTSGTPAEWAEVPDFSATDEGKVFLAATGLAPAETPAGKEEPVAVEDEEPEEEEEDVPAPAPTLKMASEDLPLPEQDLLNGLILLHNDQQKEGLAKLISAAQANNARALYELGRGYADGKYGLPASSENAKSAFRKSAMGGFALALVHFGMEFPVALSELGFRAADGNNMVKAAESANELAPSQRFNYAIMLRYGYGVRKDVDKALDIMKDLAEAGDPIAERFLEEWSE